MTQRAELAPGTYQVRNVGTGIATGITVPTLTVAIAQASPTVGQTLTLTTNAAAGAAYQWRAGGVDIGGATAATFNTTGRSVGDVITCRVVSGAQTVTSAGVTLAAAAGITPVYLGRTAIASGFPPHNHTAPVSLSAGQKYIIGVSYDLAAPIAAPTVSVNGTAANMFEESVNDDGSQIRLWEVTPDSSGTLVSLSWTLSPTATSVHTWEVPNASAVAFSVSSTATSGTVRDVSSNVNQGDGLILLAGHRGNAGVTFAGVTADPSGSITIGPSTSTAASAGNVAAATPRTITATFTDANNNNGKVVALAVIR